MYKDQIFCGIWAPTDPFLFPPFSLGVYGGIVEAGGQRAHHPVAYLVTLCVSGEGAQAGREDHRFEVLSGVSSAILFS